jgi:large subunit ribosomal protein L29
VKPEELRQLDAEELSGRLKGARRELYELRFRMAVGQLDNPRQIGRVRKDIARILTVVHERRLDEEVAQVYASAEAVVEEPVAAAASETPEQVEATESAIATAEPEAEVAEAEAAAEPAQDAVEAAPEAVEEEQKPRRTRKKSARDEEGA